jgi:hypothetical protein
MIHVAIVGLGPSSDEYVRLCKMHGGRRRFCDETWVINAFGNVLEHDLVFHMDDIRVQLARAAAAPESNIAAMVEWLRSHEKRVITSIPHPDFPALEAFPLAEVLNEFPQGYFNTTAAYAVAYALWRRAEKLTLFGCDFTYPDAHDAEKGRACVEYWLGMAAERGVQLAVSKASTLLDACNSQAQRFYGYDCVDLAISRNEAGRIEVAMTEHGRALDVAAIEAAYDHTQHPNPLCAA